MSLSEKQQEELQARLSKAELEIKKQARKIRRLEHDKESLSAMYDNAINIRDNNQREKEKQYFYNRLLLEAFPNIIFVLDENLNYTIGTSAHIARHFGFHDERELVNLNIRDIIKNEADEEWNKRLIENCQHVLQQQENIRYTDFLVSKTGEQLHLEIIISPVIENDEMIHGVALIIDNVTEMVKAKEEAEAAVKAKSSFLASMSHEIRTPMNAILGMGHLLEETELSKMQQGYLKTMLRASRSLLDIINDILDFTKIDAQRFDLVQQKYNLMELVEDVTNIVRLRADEKKLDFEIDIDPVLPFCYRGDFKRIKQVLVNLMTNAIKYTRTGSVVLQVRKGSLHGEFALEFAVIDTGIGVKEEEIGSLFDAFTQVDLKKNEGIEGTGLGLAISKGLALAMGGEITVSSTYGKGSCFTLHVPQKIENEMSIAEQYMIPEIRVLVSGQSNESNTVIRMLEALQVEYTIISDMDHLFANDIEHQENYTHAVFFEGDIKPEKWQAWQKYKEIKSVLVCGLGTLADGGREGLEIVYKPILITSLIKALGGTSAYSSEEYTDRKRKAFTTLAVKILLVDDNQINLLVTEKLLQRYGIEVTCAESGMAALEQIQGGYDLIFMDHMMPEMDGVETTRRIRQMGGELTTLPIVALTANAGEEMEELYLKNGMDAYITKPVEIEKLEEVLLEFLPSKKIEYK